MQLTWRLLPPPRGGITPINGRTYSCAAGSVLDVPDFDAFALTGTCWSKVAPSGPTSSRPQNNTTTAPYVAAPGFQYFDTTLNKLIVSDGVVWRDPATGAQV